MYETLKFHIKGIAPLILHNGRLANPLDPVAKAMKPVSAKKKKTDDDFKLLSKLEWLGGLYTSEAIAFTVENNDVKASGGGKIVLPGEGVEAFLLSGAKQLRLGPKVKAGILSDGNWELDFPDKDKTIAQLMEMEAYRDIRKVRVQQNSVMRTRPIFHEWGLKFDISYLPDVLNKEEVIQIVQMTGRVVGAFEYRPKYGRFTIEGVAAA